MWLGITLFSQHYIYSYNEIINNVEKLEDEIIPVYIFQRSFFFHNSTLYASNNTQSFHTRAASTLEH